MKYISNISGKYVLYSLAAFLLSLPGIVLAQGASGDISNIEDLIVAIGNIIDSLIPLAASLALLAFFFGLAQYIFQAGNEEAKDSGKRIMVGGIIALFLIAAVGGIIEFIASALDIRTGGEIPVPSVSPGASNG